MIIKKYLITSPEFYNHLETQIANHNPEYILYRDKENKDYETGAKTFLDTIGNISSAKLFLHQDVALAYQLRASGVHLTSLQFDAIESAKKLGLEVIVSTHTKEEVLKAEVLGADAVTYSPIFATPGKGEPKGVKDLQELVSSCSMKVFALGGIITHEHVKQIEQTNAYGFASIRYFV